VFLPFRNAEPHSDTCRGYDAAGMGSTVQGILLSTEHNDVKQ
jgi:hypothetical protein